MQLSQYCRRATRRTRQRGTTSRQPVKQVAPLVTDHLGVGGGGSIAKGPAYLPGDGYGFGLGFAVRIADGLSNLIGSKGDAHWGGITGPAFWIDPKEGLVTIFMLQAPRHRFYNRMVLRNLVYGAVLRISSPFHVF